MPEVTGSIKDIVGESMANRVAELHFRLNAPNVQATSVGTLLAGTIHPTEVIPVAPSSGGAFSVDLVLTTTMLADAWYEVGIVWAGSKEPLWDYPQWQIRVGSGGNISEKIFLRPPGGGWDGPISNLSLVLLSLTEPTNLARGQLWWKVNPNNPTDPENTGLIYVGE